MKRKDLQQIMRQAWQMVKMYGLTMAEALRKAWQNFKLRAKMALGIVKFWFAKVDGTTREAYGTLAQHLTPTTKGTERKPINLFRISVCLAETTSYTHHP
jgi:hypothetical protein